MSPKRKIRSPIEAAACLGSSIAKLRQASEDFKKQGYPLNICCKEIDPTVEDLQGLFDHVNKYLKEKDAAALRSRN